MTSEIDGLLEQIRVPDGVARACETVESWCAAQRYDDLLKLAEALEDRSDIASGERRAGVETLGDHIETELAGTEAPAAVDALLALAMRERVRSVSLPRSTPTRVRAFASRLGFGQKPSAFLSTLERAGDRAEHQEIFACWMHEVVLRGHSLADDARAQELRATLTKNHHPLASLPLALHDLEREAPSYMPLYGNKGLGRAIEALTSGRLTARTIPPPADGGAVKTSLIEDAAVHERLIAAVLPWTEGSNGKVEAKVFALEPAVGRDTFGSWLLRGLPLDSIREAPRLECQRASASAVFGALFSASSNGGAYSSGVGGAYGRRAAWTSLGALVGDRSGAEPDSIAALAARATFLTYRAPGPWFYDVAWDTGALVLRPDGRSVAVLAATDTD